MTLHTHHSHYLPLITLFHTFLWPDISIWLIIVWLSFFSLVIWCTWFPLAVYFPHLLPSASYKYGRKGEAKQHKCMCSLSWQPFLGWYWNRELLSCRSPYSARELLSRRAPYPAHLILPLTSGINFQSPFIEGYNSGLLSLQWSSIIAQVALAVAGLYIKQSLSRIEITARWPSL